LSEKKKERVTFQEKIWVAPLHSSRGCRNRGTLRLRRGEGSLEGELSFYGSRPEKKTSFGLAFGREHSRGGGHLEEKKKKRN